VLLTLLLMKFVTHYRRQIGFLEVESLCMIKKPIWQELEAELNLI
jgi:hypothetical protein